MSLRFYNTLTREKEEFTPIKEKEVGVYTCGPTVYNYAHIGNMRSYIFADLLRRVLEYNGYEVKHVMNITDVGHLLSDADEGEDKVAKTARETGKTPWEIAEFYTKAFFTDTKKLNILRPKVICKATDHIQEMIEFVQVLLEKGYAYEISDGIYFDISKLPDYGKLSRINLDEQMAGARVAVNEEKRHPADFALWKKAEPNHIMQWESPWGMGYPGWHIECSAMSIKYLGERFDIHTGGIDHIPIHHENEIAQNKAYTGHEVVNYWMHGEFLQVEGGKMSKSLGNIWTVSDLEERGYEPLAYRYMCLNAHYRKTMNFTWEGLDSAQTALNRLRINIEKFRNATNHIENREALEEYKKRFVDAINDDLNIPEALGVLWELVRNKEMVSKEGHELILDFDRVFGLKLDQEIEKCQELPDELMKMLKERAEARARKDWARSDALREELRKRGVIVKDTKEGQVWELVKK
ncbi:cysteine--tRNA ligase [Anoxybacter fermentans]|uniref:Cysteine--tRNA ligase n=1 Tax=Anoxybacter fermentans TaxID=1323375 RepID=A0A3S9SV88_9FIRM|nr:cysteine--tRNA ligase [Anoxybacter fermentans]AZR72194.1 cysteine--tRNA ligase [Anoxybacter fermentans]